MEDCMEDHRKSTVASNGQHENECVAPKRKPEDLAQSEIELSPKRHKTDDEPKAPGGDLNCVANNVANTVDTLEGHSKYTDVPNNQDSEDDIQLLGDFPASASQPHSAVTSSGIPSFAALLTLGPFEWVRQEIAKGTNPRRVLEGMVGPSNISSIPTDVDDDALWKLVIRLLTELPKRQKLPQYNTLDDAVELIKRSSRILVITGAGVSVSCGIPDFRSPHGIYAKLAKDYPDLPSPQAMFDIKYFNQNPAPFFSFAREIYPGQFSPSPSHHFIRLLEDKRKLLRNYTQNIDTLEKQAGIEHVVQCHGSFATATCRVCKATIDAGSIEADVMNQIVPKCQKCPADTEGAIMKPDIVFFGEDLPSSFYDHISTDKEACDLIIVIGSSMKVRPVSLIPDSVGANVPQILINKEPLEHINFDVEILGDCDLVLKQLCIRLGEEWSLLNGGGDAPEVLQEISSKELKPPPENNETEKEENLSTKNGETREKQPDAPESSAPESAADCASTKDDSQPQPPNPNAANTEEPDIQVILAMIPPKVNVADRLPEKSYLFAPPNRYVFPGAVVYSVDPRDDRSDDDDVLSFYDSEQFDDDDMPPLSDQSIENDADEESEPEIVDLTEDDDDIEDKGECAGDEGKADGGDEGEADAGDESKADAGVKGEADGSDKGEADGGGDVNVG